MLITKIHKTGITFAHTRRALLAAVCLAGAVFGVGCRRDMQDMPRYEVYEQSSFFKDKRASRNLPDHVVARGYLREDDALYLGKLTAANGGSGATQSRAGSSAQSNDSVSGGQTSGAASAAATSNLSDPNNVAAFPIPVTQELLDRGQERYQVFCMMCHGVTGYGDGMVVRRGYKKPTSYHDERLRQERVGHFYDVITNGWGSMPKYAAQITPRDRWAIVSYIRALQLSQNARPEDFPENIREQVLSGKGPVSNGNDRSAQLTGHAGGNQGEGHSQKQQEAGGGVH